MAEHESQAARTDAAPEGVASRVPIWNLVRYYLRLGTFGFGGPVALCGQMEKELVEERKWLTREEMREAIAVCQSLPGPLAIQVGSSFPTCGVVFGGPGLEGGPSSSPIS
jgi:chromate transport protein ChrA